MKHAIEYPGCYSVPCFHLLAALQDNKHCTPEEIKEAIYQRRLADFFAQSSISVPAKLCSDVLQEELAELADTHIDHKLLINASNGYMLIIAYLLELIQRQPTNS